MKNIISFIVLICSVAVILTSCSEDEESTTAAATSATTTTPSGSITMGSYTTSGSYKSSCFTSGVSGLISAGAFPSDVKSYGFVFVVTGDDSFSSETHSFTDTGCTNSSWVNKLVRYNVTVGTASGANYPVTYNNGGFRWTVNTTTAETFLENLYSTVVTVGIENVGAGDGSARYGLWTPSATTIYLAAESSSSTPSTAGEIVYTKE